MKFSVNYTFYPDNHSVEDAIDHANSLASGRLTEEGMPDTSVAVPDNFTHTRGNYEQRRFSTNVLESARDVLEAALSEELREQSSQEWAATQNSLGNVLGALAQNRQDVESYEKAIQSFNYALENYSQASSPMEWASTQYFLGTAQQALGRQLSDSRLLKSAVDAYTDALLVWTRDKTPQEWGAALFQLGASFHAYGKLLTGNRTLQKAVVAYKNALATLDADNFAAELVAAHNNRGAVLHHLAESEENVARFDEAIRSYETALTVSMEQQQPIHMAVICRVNLATVRGAQARLTNDALLAEEVADSFEVIVELFPHACQPLCMKYCEGQLVEMRALAEALSSGSAEQA